jgi:hypothetical protein
MSLTQYLNPDGINRTAVSAATPLPITGEITVSTTGLATDAGQTTANGYLATIASAASDTTTPQPVYVRAAEYETVAASQTDQMMGPTGGVGDTIEGILVIPATTSPGAISIEDGSTNTTVFAGGASSVSNLVPFYIPLNNIASVSGGWEITTGANVSCIVFGNFT